MSTYITQLGLIWGFQGGEVGGVWVYEPETEDDPLGVDPGRKRVFSSMYAGLRTNLPRRVPHLPPFTQP